MQRLTVVEIRNRFQNAAACIQCPRSINFASGVLAREQDDLGVDERSRGDTFVQGLAERKCGCHQATNWGYRYLLPAVLYHEVNVRQLNERQLIS